MWTSSYVLVVAGWSLSVLALAYWAVEIMGWGKETVPGKVSISRGALWPWLVFGSNAIAAYMVSELLPGISELFPFSQKAVRGWTQFGWLQSHLFELIPGSCLGRLRLLAFGFTAVCFSPLWSSTETRSS